MKIHLIAAARPNFMKIAPLYHELKKREGFEPIIVHTGQHYDLNMSDVFFKNFNLPKPHIHLDVGSGTHAFQTGNVMIDSLEMTRDKIESISVYKNFACSKGEYGLVTLHRPSNVDNPEILEKLCKKIADISKKIPLIFPVHPRTLANLNKYRKTSYNNSRN